MAVVARRANPFGEIKVITNRRAGTISYCQGSWYQSRADRSGVSLMAYIHALVSLVVEAGAERVLVIGGAGGTLGSMLARIGKRVTVVDIDRHAFAVARMYFNLAEEVDCKVADGRRFLERSRSRYDAIVLDAYCRGSAPGHLCTTEFFDLARRRLSGRGVVFFNAIVGDDRDPNADRIAAGMIAAGMRVRILDTLGETHRNAIIVAGGRHRWTRPAVLVKPSVMAAEIADELGEMIFRAPRPCDPMTDDDMRAQFQPAVRHCPRRSASNGSGGRG